ncbi:hypothetical protein [Achromobacter aegrifaciens]|uniref:hypothetical protein n=1 Tax=Achromobacter aegrifaciens TaxID=1287736 RepID=UPI00146650FE|nr:hypothetical protein [Achromobacter aegrifaciens]CAB3708988.1 hypothetical protein LMG26852_05624 [Achromobacter aegrifaciens]
MPPCAACISFPAANSISAAVLVISHDDRYFHLADRLIRMENGQIVAIETLVARDPATLAPAELAAAQ